MEAPTEAPTEAPMEAPTEVPTGVPTGAPMEAPTGAPMEAPTETPMEAQMEMVTVIMVIPVTLILIVLPCIGVSWEHVFKIAQKIATAPTREIFVTATAFVWDKSSVTALPQPVVVIVKATKCQAPPSS